MQTKLNDMQTLTVLPFVTKAYRPYLAISRMQAKIMQSTMRYQIESLGFMKHRLEQSVKFVDDILADDESGDAFDILTVYMQDAVTDYTAEAAKVASLNSKLSAEAARSLRKEAKHAMEDMATATGD